MNDVNKELKTLYKDAVYFHYLRNGYTGRKARYEVKQIFGNSRKLGDIINKS